MILILKDVKINLFFKWNFDFLIFLNQARDIMSRSSYDCVSQNSYNFSCYESVTNTYPNSNNPNTIDIYYGTCCKNVNTNKQLCCLVGLVNQKNKSAIQK